MTNAPDHLLVDPVDLDPAEIAERYEPLFDRACDAVADVLATIYALDPGEAMLAAHAFYMRMENARNDVSAFRKVAAARLNTTDGIGPRRLAVMLGLKRSYAQSLIEEGHAIVANESRRTA